MLLTARGASITFDDVPKTLTQQASGKDPLAGLRAVKALRQLADELEVVQVRNARSQGWSWSEIASVLGLTKQAVHHKHAARVAALEEGS